jgi:hypothetical protein
MNSDELSIPPGKRSGKRLMVALAAVVAVTAIALLAKSPKDKSAAARFVGYTNYDGQKRLVLQGTNGIPRQRKLFAAVGTGAIPQKAWTGPEVTFYDATSVGAAPGTNFYFTLRVPSNDIPYYVTWYLYDSPPRVTRWGKVRSWFYRFFTARSMPDLANRFATSQPQYIPSTEFKE